MEKVHKIELLESILYETTLERCFKSSNGVILFKVGKFVKVG